MHAFKGILADWGFPVDSSDLRDMVKAYLDELGDSSRSEIFKDKRPSRSWFWRFMKHNNASISHRKSTPIKRARAQVDPTIVEEYFKNLEKSLKEEDGSMIPPERIYNFDETNLADDPGKKFVIARRGAKHVERVPAFPKA